jgi:hypothetical protein
MAKKSSLKLSEMPSWHGNMVIEHTSTINVRNGLTRHRLFFCDYRHIQSDIISPISIQGQNSRPIGKVKLGVIEAHRSGCIRQSNDDILVLAARYVRSLM